MAITLTQRTTDRAITGRDWHCHVKQYPPHTHTHEYAYDHTHSGGRNSHEHTGDLPGDSGTICWAPLVKA